MLRTVRLLPPTGHSTLGFDAGRFPPTPPACYRASWQLPGPDFHRQATASLRLMINPYIRSTSSLLGAQNNTYSVLRRIVSTVNKSHATIPSAWARRNCVQVGPVRRGAGPRPCRRSSVLIVVAPTRIPSLRNSPQILTQPQRGFSLAIRSTSATTSESIGGRPGWRTFW
jgi:hypothetical protein